MLRHAPLYDICPFFLLPLLLLSSFYPPIMPSPSSFLPLDIPPYDDEDENDNGERPYEKDGDTGSEDDNGEES